jgi:hypothetical protein
MIIQCKSLKGDAVRQMEHEWSTTMNGKRLRALTDFYDSQFTVKRKRLTNTPIRGGLSVFRWLDGHRK